MWRGRQLVADSQRLGSALQGPYIKGRAAGGGRLTSCSTSLVSSNLLCQGDVTQRVTHQLLDELGVGLHRALLLQARRVQRRHVLRRLHQPLLHLTTPRPPSVAAACRVCRALPGAARPGASGVATGLHEAAPTPASPVALEPVASEA